MCGDREWCQLDLRLLGSEHTAASIRAGSPDANTLVAVRAYAVVRIALAVETGSRGAGTENARLRGAGGEYCVRLGRLGADRIVGTAPCTDGGARLTVREHGGMALAGRVHT